MKNWKIPATLFSILILAFIFRWGNLSSTTNNGIIIKTKVDHWNGSVWQTTIKKGSYREEIISSSWFESMRKPIAKTEEYKEPVYSDDKSNPFLFADKNITYITKTRTIQVPPPPIYWLSSNGLTKIWFYVTAVVGIWLIIASIVTQKKAKVILDEKLSNKIL